MGLIETDGSDPGALVIDSNGTYRQVNFKGEWVRELDGELVSDAMVRASRMDNDNSTGVLGNRKTMRMLTLDAETASILRTYGFGNLSYGIRRAAEIAITKFNGEWEDSKCGIKTQFSVSIDDPTVDILKRIGFGNMSAGARRAAKLVGTAAQPTDKPTHQK